MRELQAIVETYKQITHSDQRVSLATVVKVRGSTYRRPGARMLITQDGYSVGTISGGCLEPHVPFPLGAIDIDTPSDYEQFLHTTAEKHPPE